MGRLPEELAKRGICRPLLVTDAGLAGAARVRELNQRAGIAPRLRDYGVAAETLPALADKAIQDGRHQRNPRPPAKPAKIALSMQVLQAGQHKLILLELEPELVANIARQAGFEAKLKDSQRSITLELSAPGRQAPLLLFDAADPANLGWFSRCQFYIDGRSGGVMQTPICLANKRDRGGKAQPNSVRVNISKELPASFRLPGKQPLTEQVLYALLFNFLNALMKTGVAVCGGSVVQALAGRTEGIGPRN